MWKKSKQLNKENETERLFHESEIKTNKRTVLALRILAGIVLLFSISGSTGLLDMGDKWCCVVLAFCGFFVVLGTIYVSKKMGVYSPYAKGMLVFLVLFLSSVSYFLYPDSTVFILSGPIFLSVSYYDTRFVLRTTFGAWLAFLICIFLNIFLMQFYDEKTVLRLYVHSILMNDIRTIMIYYVTPRSLIMFLEGIIGIGISKEGRKLVLKQAEISTKAASMKSELMTAAEVQNKIMDTNEYRSSDSNIVINAEYRSAKDVGGDVFDHFMINDNLLVVTVGDVSDKGLSAAMFAREVQGIVRFACFEQMVGENNEMLDDFNLEKAVYLVNRQLSNLNYDDMFVTMWIACIDTRSGVGKYINAGHTYPYIRHADGKVEAVTNKPQFFLGTFDMTKFSSETLRLSHGDTLILYTDGITDSRNEEDETFGAERFEELIRRKTGAYGRESFASDSVNQEDSKSGEPMQSELSLNNHKVGETRTSASARLIETPGSELKISELICQNVIKGLNKFTNNKEQFDDITLLAATFLGKNTPKTKSLSITADDENTELAINELNTLLESVGCSEFERRNLDVVMDEICANITMHSESEGIRIDIDMEVGSNYLKARFSDNGMPFDPLSYKDIDATELNIGGLGIRLIRSLVDDMHYEYADGRNVLTITRIWNI